MARDIRLATVGGGFLAGGLCWLILSLIARQPPRLPPHRQQQQQQQQQQQPVSPKPGAGAAPEATLHAPAPASPPVAERPAADLSQVDAALRSLVSGHAAFQAPAEMNTGQTGEVRAVLSAKKQIADLLAQFAPGGTTGGGAVPLTDRMRASLSGSGFTISPPDPQIQAISMETDNVWTWTVEATDPGDHILELRFDAVLRIDGTDTPHFVQTFDRHIAVKVGWPSDLHGWVELARKTADDLKWVIATLVGAAGAVTTWLRGRRAPAAP